MDKPQLDQSQITQFLEFMPFAGQVHLAAIKDGSQVEFRTFLMSNRDTIVEWVIDRNGAGYNIYFHVNPTKDGVTNRKARKGDVAASVAVFIDVDDPSQQAIERVLEFPVAPSLVVFSGNGWHCYWFLNPVADDLEQAEKVGKGLAKMLGGDACWNRDRILRVPGTVNYPNKTKLKAGRKPSLCSIDWKRSQTKNRYSLGEIETQLKMPEPRQLPIVAWESPPVIYGLEDITMDGDDWIKPVIETGDDPDAPRGSKDPLYPSRSEAVFAVACELVRDGVYPDVILGILLNPDLGISEAILDKADPVAYARRQVERAIHVVSTDWPKVTKSGKPIKSFENALVAISRLEVVLEHDQFHNRKRVGGKVMQEFVGDLSDDIAVVLRKKIVEEFGFDPGKQNLLDAVHALCVENGSHSIQDYLRGLEWDCQPRLDTWLIDYCGAEDTPYVRAVGKMMLVAAVRRIKHPGTKYDTMVVLEGPQGSGKSTAICILAGDENFSDQNLFSLDDKAQMEALEGVWLYEVAELDGMSKAEVSKIKAFISRTEDRGRPAYARFKERWPRQCILIGTTNDEFYLKDSTGNRRFLPVKTNSIDLDALRRDRDMLWAEARDLESSGFSIQLPEELWATAASEQEARTQEDPWLDVLGKVTGEEKGGFERVATETLFSEEFLGIPPSHRQSYHPKRIAIVMRKLGWDGPKKIRISGKAQRGYERPVGDQEATKGPEF